MPDKPRMSIDVNTNGDNARQATRDASTLIVEIMPDKPRMSKIMPDKPRVSIDVKTNGYNARQGMREFRCQH